ncbi:MAG: hypothetical protein KIT89_02070 [Microcella sp.]|uniref:hypothetical protein n=1 Tax=Microcella sp. TaxID=1913979 RepID=UPI0024C891DD|nr:hypothetical protein [Microcella sp.]UYN84039.1 MAG: hypothetical protein KIT89_02070 [Microcella sp.]
MTNERENTAPDADELDSADYDQADRDAVQGADPDITVPGASDTAESGGQGADDRYRDGELGGGAIGGSIDDNAREGDQP